MLSRWVEHAFAQGWICIRSYVDGGGHVALDEYAQSPGRPTMQECLAWMDQGGNVEVLLHESGLFQVDAEHGAPAPWSDPAAYTRACLSRSPGGGLHAIYQNQDGVGHHRWIKPVPGVDLLSKGAWPLPGCKRTGGSKAPGEWLELSPPLAPGPLPRWVIEAFPPTRSRRATFLAGPFPLSGAWALKALAGELAAVAAARAGDGQAHQTMMVSGARLGQIVGAGHLERDSVIEQLVAAGEQAGWREQEARRCASDAVEFGSKSPRGPAELPTIEIFITDTCAKSAGPALENGEGDVASEMEHDPEANGAGQQKPGCNATGFAEARKLVTLRNDVPWIPDLRLEGDAGHHAFDPEVEPFKALRELADQVARGHVSPAQQAGAFHKHVRVIESIAGARLTERAAFLLRVWYEVVRDYVPPTDHHLTYTVAAERLSAAHGEDLLWSAVGGNRLYCWNVVFWDHDQRALAERWSDENAQTFLAEFEKLSRIADRLDRDGDLGPELLSNLRKRFPVKDWNSSPDPKSKSAAEKEKVAALGRLQSLLDEDLEHFCWRVNIAAFLRIRAHNVELQYRKLETPAGVEAVLERVRYTRQRPEEDFDRQPYLLVAKNGVIDLRTGELLTPRRDWLLTKQAGAEYRPGFRHDKWKEVLDQFTSSDDSLKRWLQAMVGYTLIGLRGGGRYIIFIFGITRTGKGTFLKIVGRALGMYASPFNARAFSDTKHSSHDEDLASLRGVRMAYASEMASARFDAEKLKSASSGDPMRPSRKGEKSFEMVPEAAIWMATNEIPRLPIQDEALMDRLRFVEFDQQFALSPRGDELANDPDVLAAVLAWAVEGAVLFQREGLPECTKVSKAGDKARSELDPLAEWFEERVVHARINDPAAFTSTALLHSDYVVQAFGSGERLVARSEFGRLLSQRKVQDAKNDSVRGWRLVLRTPPRTRP